MPDRKNYTSRSGVEPRPYERKNMNIKNMFKRNISLPPVCYTLRDVLIKHLILQAGTVKGAREVCRRRSQFC